MPKPRFTFELLGNVGAATVCSSPNCDKWAEVRFATDRSISRQVLCPTHATLAFQRWIERERRRERLERQRDEIARDAQRDSE